MSNEYREQFNAPRPSATVVLLRDATAGPESLLVLRHARTAFGASYVFPGGMVEEGDAGVGQYCDGLQPGTTGFEPDDGTAWYSAGIRELFEESGILLACRNSDPERLVADNVFDEYRHAVHTGELAWTDFLQANELRLACDRLSYFAWWVTPRHFEKRFTTRFFIAQAPRGQAASHDGKELTDSCWMRPADALQRAGKDFTLPPPTRAVLHDLGRHDDVKSALDWAAEQQAAGVRCILPAMLQDGDRSRVVLPGDSEYPRELQGQDA